jgi:hypothetical protein
MWRPVIVSDQPTDDNWPLPTYQSTASSCQVEMRSGLAGGVLALPQWRAVRGILIFAGVSLRRRFPEATAVGIALGASLVLLGLSDTCGLIRLVRRIKAPLLARGLTLGTFRVTTGCLGKRGAGGAAD